MDAMESGVRSSTASETGSGFRGESDGSAVSAGQAGFAAAEWWALLERAPRSVLMLDYDGTLAPFVRERMQARMYPGVAERLFHLAHAPRTRLVVVSGRPARDFPALLPRDLQVEIWGSHGREHITPDGRYSAIPLSAAQEKILGQLEEELRRQGFASVGSASILEKKVGSLAVHTRGLAESDAERVVDFVRDFYDLVTANRILDEKSGSGLEILPFDGGIEVRGTGRSKATAVEAVLRDEPDGVPAAYLGDDLTDEDAFAALAARGPGNASLRVLVRPQPRPSAADLWLAPPEELLVFLDRWWAAVDGTTHRGAGR